MFKTDEEALNLANDTQYGLWASIWTRSLDRVHFYTNNIQAGTVCVNCNHSVPGMPFGGYKQSGLGREMSSEAINEYTEVKSVIISTPKVTTETLAAP